jgi:hypothetical protein
VTNRYTGFIDIYAPKNVGGRGIFYNTDGGFLRVENYPLRIQIPISQDKLFDIGIYCIRASFKGRKLGWWIAWAAMAIFLGSVTLPGVAALLGLAYWMFHLLIRTVSHW